MPNRRAEIFLTVTRIATGLFVFFLVGCMSPRKKVEGHMSRLREAWQSNLVAQSTLPEKVLDWPTAVDLVLSNNLKLVQARTLMTNSAENVRQVFKDLIPT